MHNKYHKINFKIYFPFDDISVATIIIFEKTS
jgi:hypothetical protein